MYVIPKKESFDINSFQQRIKRVTNILIQNQISSKNTIGRLVVIPPKHEAQIIGDIHGDYSTLNQILERADAIQKLDEGNYLIFLGDYIDRGPKQIEVIIKVMDLYEKFPSQVIPLRGNHEGPEDISFKPHDFPQKLIERYGIKGETLKFNLQNFFNNLYTGVFIPSKALLLHGGIPTGANSLMNIIHAHDRHPKNKSLTEILWNDPSIEDGVHESTRGIGKRFGMDIASKFLNKIGAQILIRGHESCDEGFLFHDEKVLTLFSCKLPYYGNKYAAYLDTPLNISFNRESLMKYLIKI